jgi:predicted hydrolase (HD superfamily)
MPKAYLTFAEREKAAAMRERDKQLHLVSLELTSQKYKNGGFGKLQEKTGLSRPTIKKIATEPLKATIEQLYEVAFASGKKVVITIE